MQCRMVGKVGTVLYLKMSQHSASALFPSALSPGENRELALRRSFSNIKLPLLKDSSLEEWIFLGRFHLDGDCPRSKWDAKPP